MSAQRTLRLREHTIELEPGRPLIMGIVNASPDSFFDGGWHPSLDDQEARARQQLEAGARIVDVGGESGVADRPAISPDEEAARVVPLVERLAADGALVSVDTWKGEVARAALEAGAAMVNDPSALVDPSLADACATYGAGLVVTHTRAAPKRRDRPGYDDVTGDVLDLFRSRIALATDRGVELDRIVVDPGPDLAKTPSETVDALRRLADLRELGRPVLLAASRKDFIGAISGRPPSGRLGGTLAAVGEGVDSGASIVRVHDVAEVVDYLAVRAALRGERDVPGDLALDDGLRRHRGGARPGAVP